MDESKQITTKQVTRIMDKSDIDRVIARISHEIIERNKGTDSIVIIGMQTRGVNLANKLANNIEKNEGIKQKIGILDTSMYRDDFRLKFKQPNVQVTDIPFSITNKDVILVDDVLFTGRTVRAAMDALIDFGRPATIQLCVLVDRGHRELPIMANYVGKNIPTAIDEEVSVKTIETDKEDGVWLIKLDTNEKK